MLSFQGVPLFEGDSDTSRVREGLMRLFSFFATLLLLVAAPLSAETSIWKIGQKDQSSLEFTSGPRKEVVYRIGSSDWKHEWPGTQENGSKYAIEFNLESVPKGTYNLKLSVLTYQPRIPALQIEINGREGTFYLQPKVSYYLGDSRSIFDPHYSSQDLSIELPTKDLVQGKNTLVLRCVAARPPMDSPGNVSAVRYDYLELAHSEKVVTADQSVRMRLEPTVFYRKKEGRLYEVIDAVIGSQTPLASGQAMLQMGGSHYVQPYEAISAFGEKLISFEVPEWKGIARAAMSLSTGHGRQYATTLTAARKWTVFVVPHTHVDIGYTDYQGKVAEAQARSLDETADFIKKYPDFRFATDGSWNLQQFLETRSVQDQSTMLNLIKDRKVGVPAQYVNLLTGYTSLETLYRSLYYTKALSREYGIPFDYANTTDVPTYTGAYPSVLASAGLRYWVAGGNNDRAPLLSHDRWNEKSPFWWQGPDGKKVLFWYSRCYEQVMFLFGLPPLQSAVRESLPIFLQAYDKPDYKPDAVLIYGTQPENTDLFPETATFATEWNKSYEYPKLQYSTFTDFFHYLDTKYGNDLPTYTGDMGPYWEDGIGSDAANVALDRGNQNRLPSAELLAAVSHGIDPALLPPKQEINDAWNNVLLFGEHTWTAGDSVLRPEDDEVTRQLAVKDNRATQADFEINDALQRSMSQIANNISVPSQTLVVFNPLSWKRDALVDLDLYGNEGVEDSMTKAPIDVQILSMHQGFMRARFLAADLPSVGYKSYSIGPHRKTTETAAATTVVENRFYRITADPETGAIESIWDKDLQRELVDAKSPYKFGQYLYVTGGDGATRMINPFKSLPPGSLTVHGATGGRLICVQKTTWGQVLQLESSAVNTPSVRTDVTLFDNAKRIEIDVHVDKKYTTAKEAVYVAFPIASEKPQFLYANQQTWVVPGENTLAGGSLEWFTIQRWMAVKDPNVTVAITPVDAPLASFGDINRGQWPGKFEPKSATLFSYAMNNYWHTNYRAGQGGDFTFRYVLTSTGGFEPALYSRMGAESMTPAEADHLIGQDKVGNPERILPPQPTSFLSIEGSGVELVAWKIAEDGTGTILRLQETAGKSVRAKLTVNHLSFSAASLCNSVEDVLGSLPVKDNALEIPLAPHEVVTLKLNR